MARRPSFRVLRTVVGVCLLAGVLGVVAAVTPATAATHAAAAVAAGGGGRTLVTPAAPSSDAVARSTAAQHPGGDPAIYDSTASSTPGPQLTGSAGPTASLGYEATSASQFGDEITFAGAARELNNVVVTLSSYGCQSGGGYGGPLYGSPGACVTNPGATFRAPLTLNIYHPPAGGCPSSPTDTPCGPGSLIASDTQTFAIPYRPSDSPVDYNGDSNCNGNTFYDASASPPDCFYEESDNVTFDFSSQNLVLPNTVVYGVAYGTSNYGIPGQDPANNCNTTNTVTFSGDNTVQNGQTTVTTSAPGGFSGVVFGDTVSDTTTPGNIPANDTVESVSGSSLTLAYAATGSSSGGTDTLTLTGECPIDSLNLGLSLDPINLTVGSDPDSGNVFWNTTYAGFYCDSGGTGGMDVGTFRFDSPGYPGCWAEDDSVTSTVSSDSATVVASNPAPDAFEGVVPGDTVTDTDGNIPPNDTVLSVSADGSSLTLASPANTFTPPVDTTDVLTFNAGAAPYYIPAVEFNAGRAPVVTTSPSSQYYRSGQTVTLTAAASGNETPTVQWQVSTNHGSSWSNISGATSDTLHTVATRSESGSEVRAVFTNSSGTATSSPATLTLATAPVVTVQPKSQSYTAGQVLTFTSTARGGPTPTVQWQLLTDHGWYNIGGATSTTFRTAVLGRVQNGWQLRAVFTNIAGQVDSNIARLTEKR